MKTETPETDLFAAMWDSYNEPLEAIEFARKLERERDKYRAALERIEAVYVDGGNTYEDWRDMGEIARAEISTNQKP